ncbi:hypothetical protein ACMXYR_05225 [Neptuniibacter sp. QD29_5]|uniref:hypothetical protein n=1 Tax=Neptuniibacter sp. QD29_5 TaxID=3398207 RepID=UPI0039F5F66F
MSEKLHDGFVRQRRNLMMMSVFVGLYQLAGIELKKINFFGNEIVFKNPELLSVFMWVLLVYWLIRFVQFSGEMGDKGLKGDFLNLREPFIRYFAYRIFKGSKGYKRIIAESDKNLVLQHRGMEIYENGLFESQGAVNFLLNEEGAGGLIEKFQFDLGIRAMFMSNIAALARVMLFTRHITEYTLPLVMFILAYLTSVESVAQMILGWIVS